MTASKQIYTGLYHLDTRDVDFDVAHIYEHLLIETFKRFIVKRGISRYLFGWVSGETFQDTMFIEYGFYSQETENLFMDFMKKGKRIDMSLLDNELRRIEAEELSVVKSFDTSNVTRQLKKLDSVKFISHKDQFEPVHIEEGVDNATRAIVFKRSKNSFREVAISFGIETTVLKEKLAFLRLQPVINDFLDDFMFTRGAYSNRVSHAIGKRNSNAVAVLTTYMLHRGEYTVNNLTNQLGEECKKMIDAVIDHPGELYDYVDGFICTPNWHTLPVEYYRYTGMLTSKKAIAEALSSPKYAASLLDRIEFKIEAATTRHNLIIESHS